MGSGERKNKNSNRDTNNKSNNNGVTADDASLSDDYSYYSETETTMTTIDERILQQRSSRRDISTSSTELDRVGTNQNRRRVRRCDSARRHNEPRDQRGKPPLVKKPTLKQTDRNDPCRRTLKCVNASGCKYVDLNYSIAKTKAAKEAAKAAKAEAKAQAQIEENARSKNMPPHTDKDYGDRSGSKRHNHSREKSNIERRHSQKKSEKEKKKRKEDKESKGRGGGGGDEKAVTPNCPLCTKPFKSPIVLTCAHTFCKSCVTVLVEAGDGTSYQCPVCLSISSLTGSDEELFCPNFVILQMLEKESSVENYVCSVCDHANEAKHYCKECSDLLCHVCYDAHQVVKYTKDHTVSKLSSSSDLSKLIKKKYHCIQHENEKLGMYCTSCNESICRECAFAYHTGSQHKCISVEDAASTNRDIMKRRLFDIKSRTPKFQLMLLDIKRLKGLLRTQVKSVRAGISTSINTLITSLKEKEKELYKSADKIFGDKLKKLKEQKDGLERELEKHEALGRMLIQLDKHDNDVEMLQMNEAISRSLEMLDKPPKTNIKFDKHTFLLRSNEVNLAKEISKHGEIYCANKTTGEISLVEPDEDDVELTPRKKSAVGRLKKTAQGDDSIIMFSELEDGILPTGDECSMFDGVLQDMDVVKAKALKARANWLLLKSHLPGIVRFGKKAGLIQNEPKHRFFPGNRSSTMNKNTRNKAKKLKAKANWLLTRARLKQIVQQKHPPTPVQYRSTREKQSVLQILQSGTKYSKKLTRATAIKARARANWLLVRSRLSNIIAYGRITGVLQFKPQSLPLTPLAYRRKREQKIMASIMHLRAIISRARANWLLVKSRLKDIAKYQRKSPKANTKKPTWRVYRQQLYNTRQSARKNIAESGSVRARANWLILKTLIPDIILFGKYQESFADTRQKNANELRYKKKNPNSLDNWETLMNDDNERNSKRSTKEPLNNWDELMNEKNIRNSKSKEKPSYDRNENGMRESYDNWDELMNEKNSRNSSKRYDKISNNKKNNDESFGNWDQLMNDKNNRNSKKNKDKKEDRHDESFDNWDSLMQGHSTTTKEKESSKNWESLISSNAPSNKESRQNWDLIMNHKASPKIDKLESYQLWDLLIMKTEVVYDKRNKTSFEPQSSSQTETETEAENVNIQRKIDSFKNWDKISSATQSHDPNDWKMLIHNTPLGDDVTDEYLNTTDEIEEYDTYVKQITTPPDVKKPRSIPEIIKNWRILIGGTIVARTSTSINGSLSKRVSFNRSDRAYAINDWHRLIQGTPTNEALRHWDELCSKETPKNAKRDKSEELANWDKLAVSRHSSKRSNAENQRSSKGKGKPEMDNWDKLMGSDAPKGKPKAANKGDLENWDRLTNTKYGERQEEERGRKKTRPRSLDLENWDVLTNAKYSEKSPTRSSKKGKRPKSIDLENWDKLVQTKYSDRHENSDRKKRAKSADFENWDKLVNSKYDKENISKGGKRASKKDLENWGKIARGGQYEDEMETPKKRQPTKDDLNNWDKLTKQTKNNPYINVRPDILTNWDRLISPAIKSNIKQKIQNSPLTKSKSVDGLNNWDTLVDKQNTGANALSSSAKRNAHNNWYIITRDRELDQKALKRLNDLQKRKENSDNSENEEDTDVPQKQKVQKSSNSKKKKNNKKGLTPEAEAKALENWEYLIEGAIQKKPRKESSSSSSGKEKIKKRGNKGSKPKKIKYASSSTSLNEEEDEEEESEEEEEDLEAIMNWNILIKGNDAFRDWDTLISGYIKKDEEDDDQSSMSEVVKYTTKNEKVKLGRLDDEEDSENTNVKVHSLIEREQSLILWDKLIEGKIVRSEKEIEDASSTCWKQVETTQSSLASSSATATPIVTQKNSFKKSPTAKGNWKALLKGNRQDSYEQYDGTMPSNIQTLFEKPPIEIGSEVSTSVVPSTTTTPKREFPECDSQFLSMNVKTSKGDFQNVKLQLTSPDKSILSAHIAENGDGTFTIFCCPRIDDDFNMFVSLQGSAFKNDVQVLNLYGSFAGLKSRERELACKTINLIRWHLTPGLLRKKGDKIFPISTGLT